MPIVLPLHWRNRSRIRIRLVQLTIHARPLVLIVSRDGMQRDARVAQAKARCRDGSARGGGDEREGPVLDATENGER
jgi:hypothetical protein